MLLIEPHFEHGLGLAHDFFIDERQERRVVDGRVLNQDKHSHIRPAGVIIHVEAIFSVLDESQQQIGIARPDEDLVDPAGILVFWRRVNASGGGGQKGDGGGLLQLFNFRGKGKSVQLSPVWRSNPPFEFFLV